MNRLQSLVQERGQLRAFLNAGVASRAEQCDIEQQLPETLLTQLAEQKFLGAQVSAEYGGSMLDAHQMGLLCEELGRASGSVLSLMTVHGMVSQALGRWSSETQRKRWLPRLASGESIAAFALTEPDAGSDVTGVQTVIRRETDRFVINGVKKWISFACIADLFLIVGKYEGKLISLLVPRRTEGLVVQPIYDMLGFRAAMLGRIELSECAVPLDSLVGNLNFGVSQIVGSVLDHGRYCIAWGGVGIAQGCLDACLDYAQRRKVSGQYLSEQPLIQQMITGMAVNTQAARLMCQHAGNLRASADPEMIMATTMAKYFSAESADRIAGDALQLHGANGFSCTYPIQRYVRDAKVLKIIEGSSQVQQGLIAQHSFQTYGLVPEIPATHPVTCAGNAA